MQMVISAIVMVNCGKYGNSVSNIKKTFMHIFFFEPKVVILTEGVLKAKKQNRNFQANLDFLQADHKTIKGRNDFISGRSAL